MKTIRPRYVRHSGFRAAALAITGIAALLAVGCNRSHTSDTASTASQNRDIGCLGRILPVGGTFFVSPYTIGGAPPLVDRVDIKEGQQVTAGQPIARLSTAPYLASATAEAQAQVALAQARLARTRAAASSEDLTSAQQEVVRLKEERDQASRDYNRNLPLYQKDFLAKSQIEAMATRLHEADAMLAQAEQRVHALQNVRPDDIAISRAQVAVASADLAQARQNASSGIVRAPVDAVVLHVNAHGGEPVGPQGIAEFAANGKLQVVAEVYETDLGRVHPGQSATITADFLSSPLQATVASLGSQVQPQSALSDGRGVPSDARVLEVHLDVADQAALAGRIKGRVHVVIHP